MTVVAMPVDEDGEVPGQLDLLNQIPGETRGSTGNESEKAQSQERRERR